MLDTRLIEQLNDSLIELAHCAVDSSSDTSSRIPASNLTHGGVVLINSTGNLVESISRDVAISILSHVGTLRDIFNHNFHRSWTVIADTPLADLYIEQLRHYLSTYGREMLGFSAKPYIPVDKCFDVFGDIISPDESCKLVVIRLVDYPTAIDTISQIATTMTKPSSYDMALLMDAFKVIHSTDTLDLDISVMKSFEIIATYCGEFGIVPKDPQTFLRIAIYLATGSTLIIKNSETIQGIKSGADNTLITDWFKQADLTELSKIFLRNKPLFLAFKANKEIAPIINKIRRLAIHNHKPLPDVSVANVMKLMKAGKVKTVADLISKSNIRDVIKLYNFACASDVCSDKAIYNIRNGKVYVTDKHTDMQLINQLKSLCFSNLQLMLVGKFTNRKFYIPSGIKYAMPISEKQMLGNIPYGTSINAKGADAFCVSVAWNNYNNVRTDIDLHLSSPEGSYGWNTSYRSDARDILYSGDMTDATNGATETFRIIAHKDIPYLVSVNLYSGPTSTPFKLFLSAADDFRNMGDGMVDISKALTAPINLAFGDHNSMSLGYVIEDRFVVYGGSLGASIVPKAELYQDALSAIMSRCENVLSLNDFIRMGSGIIVTEPEDDAVDFSPENVLKSTFFDLLDTVEEISRI